MKNSDDPRPTWRRPTIQSLETAGKPECNPGFPQASVCASQGLVQSSVGCSSKGIFS